MLLEPLSSAMESMSIRNSSKCSLHAPVSTSSCTHSQMRAPPLRLLVMSGRRARARVLKVTDSVLPKPLTQIEVQRSLRQSRSASSALP